MSYQFVFNQYYIDLLKRLKTESKKLKESDDDEKVLLGKTITKSIKDNYMTIDKTSDMYIKYMNSLDEEIWKSYLDIEDIEERDQWFLKENITDTELFHNITIGDIFNILNDTYLCHHFISVFYIFKSENNDEQIAKIVKYLQGTDNTVSIDTIEDDDHKKLLLRLKDTRHKQIKDNTGVDLKGIENTTLGKLAKEILQDVDIEKIQKSIGENGDVLKAIGDPDSGFTELITNVSRKMASKISSGELKQENLMQDALQFASIIPGMFGNTQNSNGQSNSPDMSGMMDMMSKMMGNKNSMDMFKTMAGQMNHPKGARQSFDTSAIKKTAYAKKLKAKLNSRREKEN